MSKPKIAGIVVDDWKLPTFKKHLDAAKLKYTVKPNFVEGVTMLQVECQFASEVQPAVEAATKECAKGKH